MSCLVCQEYALSVLPDEHQLQRVIDSLTSEKNSFEIRTLCLGWEQAGERGILGVFRNCQCQLWTLLQGHSRHPKDELYYLRRGLILLEEELQHSDAVSELPVELASDIRSFFHRLHQIFAEVTSTEVPSECVMKSVDSAECAPV